jgi:hypothetical protein
VEADQRKKDKQKLSDCEEKTANDFCMICTGMQILIEMISRVDTQYFMWFRSKLKFHHAKET